MLKRLSVELVVAVGALAAITIPATAVARSDTRTARRRLRRPPRGDLKVGIAIKRFRANNNQPVAKGTATAQILDYAGHKTIIRQSVTGVPCHGQLDLAQVDVQAECERQDPAGA